MLSAADFALTQWSKRSNLHWCSDKSSSHLLKIEVWTKRTRFQHKIMSSWSNTPQLYKLRNPLFHPASTSLLYWFWAFLVPVPAPSPPPQNLHISPLGDPTKVGHGKWKLFKLSLLMSCDTHQQNWVQNCQGRRCERKGKNMLQIPTWQQSLLIFFILFKHQNGLMPHWMGPV